MLPLEENITVCLCCHQQLRLPLASLPVFRSVRVTRRPERAAGPPAIRHKVWSVCVSPVHRLISVLSRALVVVTHGQHQRNEAAQHQSSHLELAQSFTPVSSWGGVAVAAAAHFREDVDCGDVEEGPGGEEHGDTGGVDVWESLLTALKGQRKERMRGSISRYFHWQTFHFTYWPFSVSKDTPLNRRLLFKLNFTFKTNMFSLC